LKRSVIPYVSVIHELDICIVTAVLDALLAHWCSLDSVGKLLGGHTETTCVRLGRMSVLPPRRRGLAGSPSHQVQAYVSCHQVVSRLQLSSGPVSARRRRTCPIHTRQYAHTQLHLSRSTQQGLTCLSISSYSSVTLPLSAINASRVSQASSIEIGKSSTTSMMRSKSSTGRAAKGSMRRTASAHQSRRWGGTF